MTAFFLSGNNRNQENMTMLHVWVITEQSEKYSKRQYSPETWGAQPQTPSLSLKQCHSYYSVTGTPPRGLVKRQPLIQWVYRGPEILQFQQLLGDAHSAGPRTTLPLSRPGSRHPAQTAPAHVRGKHKLRSWVRSPQYNPQLLVYSPLRLRFAPRVAIWGGVAKA